MLLSSSAPPAPPDDEAAAAPLRRVNPDVEVAIAGAGAGTGAGTDNVAYAVLLLPLYWSLWLENDVLRYRRLVYQSVCVFEFCGFIGMVAHVRCQCQFS